MCLTVRGKPAIFRPTTKSGNVFTDLTKQKCVSKQASYVSTDSCRSVYVSSDSTKGKTCSIVFDGSQLCFDRRTQSGYVSTGSTEGKMCSIPFDEGQLKLSIFRTIRPRENLFACVRRKPAVIRPFRLKLAMF